MQSTMSPAAAAAAPGAGAAGAGASASAAFTFKVALEQLNSLLADKTITYDQFLAGMARLRETQ